MTESSRTLEITFLQKGQVGSSIGPGSIGPGSIGPEIVKPELSKVDKGFTRKILV